MQGIDGRITSASTDSTIEDDMLIERVAHDIGDGLVLVVAFDQNCKEAGDAASAGSYAEAGSFQQTR